MEIFLPNYDADDGLLNKIKNKEQITSKISVKDFPSGPEISIEDRQLYINAIYYSYAGKLQEDETKYVESLLRYTNVFYVNYFLKQIQQKPVEQDQIVDLCYRKMIYVIEEIRTAFPLAGLTVKFPLFKLTIEQRKYLKHLAEVKLDQQLFMEIQRVKKPTTKQEIAKAQNGSSDMRPKIFIKKFKLKLKKKQMKSPGRKLNIMKAVEAAAPKGKANEPIKAYATEVIKQLEDLHKEKLSGEPNGNDPISQIERYQKKVQVAIKQHAFVQELQEKLWHMPVYKYVKKEKAEAEPAE